MFQKISAINWIGIPLNPPHPPLIKGEKGEFVQQKILPSVAFTDPIQLINSYRFYAVLRTENLENFFSTNRFGFFTLFDGFGKCDIFKWLHAVAASFAPKDIISFENLQMGWDPLNPPAPPLLKGEKG